MNQTKVKKLLLQISQETTLTYLKKNFRHRENQQEYKLKIPLLRCIFELIALLFEKFNF